LATEPRSIAFFDDAVENVAEAAASGMQAHHVAGFADLERNLARLGIPAGIRRPT
jgi:hypothetical protein